MPQINHDSPPGRKTRFSLASLLLIVTVLALAISYYLKSREMEDAKKELVEYRFQHGNLVVDDATKPHLLTYVDQQNPWKWYAFFPAKKKYRIMSGVGTIDTDKVPDASGLQHVGVLEVVGKGELTTLSVTLRDLDAKTVELKVAHDNASISRAFPKKDVPWLAKDNATSKSSGHKEQFVGESDNPFVIFWSRKPKITRTATSTMVTLDTAPTDGIAVWAVPVN